MELTNKYFRVLNDGFVALKDHMGTDEDIEQAARVSYGKGTRKSSETRGLIRYLLRHRHSTPFEMCELKFHIRMPMDAHRQQIRHRTASVNEYSTRYSEAIDSRQQTPSDQWRQQSTSNKQGSGEYLGKNDGEYLTIREESFHQLAQEIYQERIDAGVAREQARKDLPLSTYTEYYWKIDLKNLLGYMSLRCDSHAQLEIRQYANIMAGIVKELYPITFEAWYDYQFAASSFTRLDSELLQFILQRQAQGSIVVDMLNDEKLVPTIKAHAKNIGMSAREITEFFKKLSPLNVDVSQFDLKGRELYENHN